MASRISIFEFGNWSRKLDKKMREAAERGLLSAAVRLQGHVVNVVIPAEKRIPVDRGVYRAGWRVRRIPGGALLYNAVPYASIVEHGARASNIKIGRKMIEALTEWVRRKGIGGGTAKSGRPRKLSLDDARPIAWAIATSMKKRGIFNDGKGLGILAKANRMVSGFVDEEVKRELRRNG